MVKLYAVEFQSNIAHGPHGGPRQDFAAGDVLVVATREEWLYLMRLGCTLKAEAEVGYEDINWPAPETLEEEKPTGYAAKTVVELKKELADRSEELEAAGLELKGNEKKADLVALLEKLDANK
jgi:hypothetical protein